MSVRRETDGPREHEQVALAKARILMRPDAKAQALIDHAFASQDTEEMALAQLVMTLILSPDEVVSIDRAVDDDARAAVARELLGSPAGVAERFRQVIGPEFDVFIQERALMTKTEAVSLRSALGKQAMDWGVLVWEAIGGDVDE